MTIGSLPADGPTHISPAWRNSTARISSYIGTNLSAFTRTRRNILRRELGLAPDTPLVGMVCYMYAPKRFLGKLAGLKGHENSIAALQLAKKKCPILMQL